MKMRMPGTAASRAIVAFALLLAPMPAVAATCSLNTPTMAFGSYTWQTAKTASTTVTVTCTPDHDIVSNSCVLNYDLSGDAGLYGSFASRQMSAGGADRLNYNLYHAGSSVVWGDGTSGSQKMSGTITTTPSGITCPQGANNHTVDGEIPSAQSSANPGDYSDTVTVTVEW